MSRTVQYYRGLPYRHRVRPEEDSTGERYFVAWIEELPWIRTDGVTRHDALYNLQQVFPEAIKTMLAAGDEIAEPEAWPHSLGPVGAGTGSGDAVVMITEAVEATTEGAWKDVEVVEEPETAGSC